MTALPLPIPARPNAVSSAYAVPGAGDAPIDLHLDRNEGPLAGDAAGILAGVGAAALNRYPDGAALRRRLAGRAGVDPRRVIVTAGGDDAIDRAIRLMLAPGRELLTASPTFEMYARYARLAGGSVREVPWDRRGFPIADLLDALTPATAVIAIATPNNPTGLVARAEDLRRLAAAAPHALLLADLAYAEFADDDPAAALQGIRNAVLVRTLSKAWGLAGLRVGWAVAGDPIIAEGLRAAGHPYPVAGPSLAVADALLAGRAAPAVERIRREREAIRRCLLRGGADPWPSQGNFVFAAVPDAAAVRSRLAGAGIAVRGFAGAIPDCLRITCPGNPADLERLLGALAAALSPIPSAEDSP